MLQMVELSQLHNTYYGLRHGQSKANEEGIIASGETGMKGYGLTELGIQQVRRSIIEAKEAGILDQDAVLVSSPLPRARETAEIAARVLGIPQEEIIFTSALRERDFGHLEGKSWEYYHHVWADDPTNPDRTDGIESTAHVRERMVSVVALMEGKYQKKKIVLVGHEDPLKILETAFTNVDSGHHRNLEPMQNAALRRYNQAVLHE